MAQKKKNNNNTMPTTLRWPMCMKRVEKFNLLFNNLKTNTGDLFMKTQEQIRI